MCSRKAKIQFPYACLLVDDGDDGLAAVCNHDVHGGAEIVFLRPKYQVRHALVWVFCIYGSGHSDGGAGCMFPSCAAVDYGRDNSLELIASSHIRSIKIFCELYNPTIPKLQHQSARCERSPSGEAQVVSRFNVYGDQTKSTWLWVRFCAESLWQRVK